MCEGLLLNLCCLNSGSILVSLHFYVNSKWPWLLRPFIIQPWSHIILVPVAMSEELQIELMEHSPMITRLFCAHPGETEPPEDWLQDAPYSFCDYFCLLLPYSCCSWHDVITIQKDPTVSSRVWLFWGENPPPHWAIYLQIIMKMIFIRAMMVSKIYDLIGCSELA